MAGKRVLVVDDEPELTEIVSIYLDELGLRPVAAVGGRQALEKIQGEAFDLIFTDIMMPEMTGFELIRELRRLGHKVPAVIYTGYSSEIEKASTEREELNIVAMIDKPFKYEDIAISVQDFI